MKVEEVDWDKINWERGGAVIFAISLLSDLLMSGDYRDLYTQRRILQALVRLAELLEDKPLLK